MRIARVIATTLLVVLGFGVVRSQNAAAQELPTKPNFFAVTTHREARRDGIPKAELPKAREAFKAFAKYHADIIAHKAVWTASLDTKIDPQLPTIDGLFRDYERFLIDTTPGVERRNTQPWDYINELGTAMDAALKPLIETHEERVVRINAARMLALAARSGAIAHYSTVTTLLEDPKVRPEIKNHMLQAAAALLSAYDVSDPTIRKHSADVKTVGALVHAVQQCIDNPAVIMPGLKIESATEDELQVIGFIRRQAIRALAQVKFVTVLGADGRTQLYPSYTLVRVAMSDPALVPAPSPADAAEAVIGLCNMAPLTEMLNGAINKPAGFNVEVVVEAILQGLDTFAGPRAANPSDRSLPWRTYALRIGEAMHKWRPLFDDTFNPLRPNQYEAKTVPPVVEDTYKFVIPNILAPMEKVDLTGKPDPGAPIRIQDLRNKLVVMRKESKRKLELFTGVKETSIDFAAKD